MHSNKHISTIRPAICFLGLACLALNNCLKPPVGRDQNLNQLIKNLTTQPQSTIKPPPPPPSFSNNIDLTDLRIKWISPTQLAIEGNIVGKTNQEKQGCYFQIIDDDAKSSRVLSTELPLLRNALITTTFTLEKVGDHNTVAVFPNATNLAQHLLDNATLHNELKDYLNDTANALRNRITVQIFGPSANELGNAYTLNLPTKPEKQELKLQLQSAKLYLDPAKPDEPTATHITVTLPIKKGNTADISQLHFSCKNDGNTTELLALEGQQPTLPTTSQPAGCVLELKLKLEQPMDPNTLLNRIENNTSSTLYITNHKYHHLGTEKDITLSPKNITFTTPPDLIEKLAVFNSVLGYGGEVHRDVAMQSFSFSGGSGTTPHNRFKITFATKKYAPYLNKRCSNFTKIRFRCKIFNVTNNTEIDPTTITFDDGINFTGGAIRTCSGTCTAFQSDHTYAAQITLLGINGTKLEPLGAIETPKIQSACPRPGDTTPKLQLRPLCYDSNSAVLIRFQLSNILQVVKATTPSTPNDIVLTLDIQDTKHNTKPVVAYIKKNPTTWNNNDIGASVQCDGGEFNHTRIKTPPELTHDPSGDVLLLKLPWELIEEAINKKRDIIPIVLNINRTILQQIATNPTPLSFTITQATTFRPIAPDTVTETITIPALPVIQFTPMDIKISQNNGKNGPKKFQITDIEIEGIENIPTEDEGIKLHLKVPKSVGEIEDLTTTNQKLEIKAKEFWSFSSHNARVDLRPKTGKTGKAKFSLDVMLKNPLNSQPTEQEIPLELTIYGQTYTLDLIIPALDD